MFNVQEYIDNTKEKLNQYVLSRDDAMFLIKEWNERIQEYGFYSLGDVKWILTIVPNALIDYRFGWDEPIQVGRDILENPFSLYDADFYKLNLKPCKLR